MKNENRVLAIFNGYEIFVGNHWFMQPQTSCPVQRIQSYLAILSFASIQACCETMSLEQQARRMLTSNAKTEGGFEYACEYYTACCAFLSGTDPSMPSKTLLQPNDLNIDRLLKVNAGGCFKIHTGDCLITKTKHDCAELQNCYMPLLTNEVCPTYPNIGSGKTWDQIQEVFRLLMWQERCKCLLNENMKEVEKALKEAQGRLQSFKDATNINPPSTVEAGNARLAQRQELRTGIENLEAKLAKETAAIDAGPPALAQDWYPVEWVVWLHFGPSREFQYGPDSWLSPRNGAYASSGPEPSLHNKEAGKAARAAIPSHKDLRNANDSYSPAGSVSCSSGTSTPSAPDAVDRLVDTRWDSIRLSLTGFRPRRYI
jgi:hypothetical protein